jgi:hypothetical protein
VIPQEQAAVVTAAIVKAELRTSEAVTRLAELSEESNDIDRTSYEKLIEINTDTTKTLNRLIDLITETKKSEMKWIFINLTMYILAVVVGVISWFIR